MTSFTMVIDVWFQVSQPAEYERSFKNDDCIIFICGTWLVAFLCSIAPRKLIIFKYLIQLEI